MKVGVEGVEEIDVELVVGVLAQVRKEDVNDLVRRKKVENQGLEFTVLVESRADDAVEYLEGCLPHPHYCNIRVDIVEYFIEDLELLQNQIAEKFLEAHIL